MLRLFLLTHESRKLNLIISGVHGNLLSFRDTCSWLMSLLLCCWVDLSTSLFASYRSVEVI